MFLNMSQQYSMSTTSSNHFKLILWNFILCHYYRKYGHISFLSLNGVRLSTALKASQDGETSDSSTRKGRNMWKIWGAATAGSDEVQRNQIGDQSPLKATGNHRFREEIGITCGIFQPLKVMICYAQSSDGTHGHRNVLLIPLHPHALGQLTSLTKGKGHSAKLLPRKGVHCLPSLCSWEEGIW